MDPKSINQLLSSTKVHLIRREEEEGKSVTNQRTKRRTPLFNNGTEKDNGDEEEGDYCNLCGGGSGGGPVLSMEEREQLQGLIEQAEMNNARKKGIGLDRRTLPVMMMLSTLCPSCGEGVCSLLSLGRRVRRMEEELRDKIQTLVNIMRLKERELTDSVPVQIKEEIEDDFPMDMMNDDDSMFPFPSTFEDQEEMDFDRNEDDDGSGDDNENGDIDYASDSNEDKDLRPSSRHKRQGNWKPGPGRARQIKVNFACGTCDAAFTHLENFKNHLKDNPLHHPPSSEEDRRARIEKAEAPLRSTKGPPFPCICGKSFTLKRNRDRHYGINHLGWLYHLRCKGCCKKFWSPAELVKHTAKGCTGKPLDEVEGIPPSDDIGQLKEENSDRSTWLPGPGSFRHIKVNFACGSCEAAFIHEEHYSEHLQDNPLHHPPSSDEDRWARIEKADAPLNSTEGPPFPCKCGRSFTLKRNRDRHYGINHLGWLYHLRCKRCCKQFLSEGDLAKHTGKGCREKTLGEELFPGGEGNFEELKKENGEQEHNRNTRSLRRPYCVPLRFKDKNENAEKSMDESVGSDNAGDGINTDGDMDNYECERTDISYHKDEDHEDEREDHGDSDYSCDSESDCEEDNELDFRSPSRPKRQGNWKPGPGRARQIKVNFSCGTCEAAFIHEADFNSHFQDKPFHQPPGTEQDRLARIQKAEVPLRSTKGPPFQCICRKSFSLKRNRDRHYAITHLGWLYHLRCTVCKRQCWSQAELDKHTDKGCTLKPVDEEEIFPPFDELKEEDGSETGGDDINVDEDNYECEPLEVSYFDKDEDDERKDDHDDSDCDNDNDFQPLSKRQGNWVPGPGRVRQMKVNFACGTCESAFIHEEDYNYHLQENPLHHPPCSEEDRLARIYKAEAPLRSTEGPPFPCGCGKSFAHKRNRDRHYAMNHLGWMYHLRCNLCQKQFYTQYGLMKHTSKGCSNNAEPLEEIEIIPERDSKGLEMDNKEEQEEQTTNSFRRPYACDQCDRSYSHTQSLRNHKILDHTSNHEMNHSCPTCGRSFKLKFQLNQHIRRHTKPFLCPNATCGKHFGSRMDLKKHFRSFHAELGSEGMLICTVCKKKFKYTYQRLVHEKIVHRGQSVYKCKECNKVFPFHGFLAKHVLERHHREPYPEETIKPNFTSLQAPRARRVADSEIDQIINANMKSSNPKHSKPKSFPCEICGRSFTSPRSLKYHRNSAHGGSDDFPCPECGKIFKNEYYRTLHVRQSHEKSYLCTTCGKRFGTSRYLERHEKAYHTELGRRANLVCNTCGEKFKTTTLRLAHERSVHKGKETYKCGECERVFPFKPDFDRHMAKGKHLKKSHRCDQDQCTFASAHPNALRIHRREVHGFRIKAKKRRRINGVLVAVS